MPLLSKIVRYRLFTINFIRNATSSVSDNDFENARPYEEIPKIPSLPFVRSTWIYFPLIGKYDLFKRHETDMRKYKEYGKIIREDVGLDNDLLLLYDPNDIEKMYRFEGRYPSRITFKTYEHYIKQNKDQCLAGLFSSDGEKWYNTRSKFQKHVTKPDLVSGCLPDVNNICNQFVENLFRLSDSKGELQDLMNELNKLSLEIGGVHALDKKLGCLSPEITIDSEPMKVLNALGEFFALLIDLEYGPEFHYKVFQSKKWKRYTEALNTFNRFTKKHIDEILERISKKDANDETPMTLLETLLKIEKMDQIQAVTSVNDMLLAGTYATSHSIAFALYLISKNPETQEKAYQEVIKYLPQITSDVTIASLNEMRYLKACLKESMRMLPVISYNRRQIPQDIVLSGYKIPAGTICVAQSQALCSMEQNFPEPMKFKPERWLGEHRKESHPFALLPFGFGPRNCIGRKITEQAMWTFVAKMLRNYKMEYHHEDIDLKTKFINEPTKPLKIKFVRRM